MFTCPSHSSAMHSACSNACRRNAKERSNDYDGGEINSGLCSAKNDSAVNRKSVRQRTSVLKRDCAAVSGRDAEDLSCRAQKSHEVARLAKEDRRLLLRDSGLLVLSNNVLAPRTGLALKAELALPWNKLWILRRILRKIQKRIFVFDTVKNRWIKS